MKEKATIYDYARVCRYHKNNCRICTLGKNCLYYFNLTTPHEEIDEMNEIILNWCKDYPVTTRQDKFLEMFPNAIKDNGVINICPLVVESGYLCLRKTEPLADCNICHSKYWLAEVEE